jgi:hypothetical protein
MKEIKLIVTLEFSEEIDDVSAARDVASNVINALEYAVNTAGLAPEQPNTCYTTSISIISLSDDSFELVREL